MNIHSLRQFRGASLLLHLVMVIVAFAINPWVETDVGGWGLWKVCYSNLTAANITDESEKCPGISFGDDSPAYFQLVRGLAIVLLIVSIVQLSQLDENGVLGRGKVPVFVAFICAILSAAIVGIMGFNGVPDDKWLGQNGKLSTGFYISIVCIVTSFILIILNHLLSVERVIEEENARVKREAEEKARKLREAKQREAKAKEEAEKAKKAKEAAEKARKAKEAEEKAKKAKADAEKARKAKEAAEKAKKAREVEEKLRKARELVENAKKVSSPLKRNSVAPAPAIAAFSTSDAHYQQGQNSVDLPGVHRSLSPEVFSYSPFPSAAPQRFESDYFPEELSDESDMSILDIADPYQTDIARNDLYCDDLRSASRASVLHEQSMKRKVPKGELPLLDTMPSYTLPPSRASKIPKQPPPSYDAAMRHYLDMPPPPEVSVPIDQFSNNLR